MTLTKQSWVALAFSALTRKAHAASG